MDPTRAARLLRSVRSKLHGLNRMMTSFPELMRGLESDVQLRSSIPSPFRQHTAQSFAAKKRDKKGVLPQDLQTLLLSLYGCVRDVLDKVQLEAEGVPSLGQFAACTIGRIVAYVETGADTLDTEEDKLITSTRREAVEEWYASLPPHTVRCVLLQHVAQLCATRIRMACGIEAIMEIYAKKGLGWMTGCLLERLVELEYPVQHDDVYRMYRFACQSNVLETYYKALRDFMDDKRASKAGLLSFCSRQQGEQRVSREWLHLLALHAMDILSTSLLTSGHDTVVDKCTEWSQTIFDSLQEIRGGSFELGKQAKEAHEEYMSGIVGRLLQVMQQHSSNRVVVGMVMPYALWSLYTKTNVKHGQFAQLVRQSGYPSLESSCALLSFQALLDVTRQFASRQAEDLAAHFGRELVAHAQTDGKHSDRIKELESDVLVWEKQWLMRGDQQQWRYEAALDTWIVATPLNKPIKRVHRHQQLLLASAQKPPRRGHVRRAISSEDSGSDDDVFTSNTTKGNATRNLFQKRVSTTSDPQSKKQKSHNVQISIGEPLPLTEEYDAW